MSVELKLHVNNFILPTNTAFYFLRHGQTDWNYNRVIMGQTDIPINETGLKQAISAAQILKNIEIQSIFSSPLKRAKQTAEIINHNYNLQIKFLDSLKERTWGEGEGSNKDFFNTSISDDYLPKGAESSKTFQERVYLSFKQMLEHENQPILVVSHGGVFKVLTEILGFENSMRTDNCVPYKFIPPKRGTTSWVVKEVI